MCKRVQLWSDQKYSSIIEIDHCMRYPCQHGGTCLKSISGWYICVCPPGYSGQNCEVSKYSNIYQSPCTVYCDLYSVYHLSIIKLNFFILCLYKAVKIKLLCTCQNDATTGTCTYNYM